MTTQARLEDSIWRELAWRKKELLELRLQMRATPTWALPMQVRGGVTLLYAHWEGFVKAAGEMLVAFVGEQGLRYQDLAPGYLAMALRPELAAVRQSERNVLTPEVLLARAVIDRQAQPAKLKVDGSVPTASNLSWRQFEMVAARLEMRTNELELLEHMIDHSLVHLRNTIAHGDRSSPLSLPDYLVLHSKVLALLDRVAHEVLRVADDRAYLR